MTYQILSVGGCLLFPFFYQYTNERLKNFHCIGKDFKKHQSALHLSGTIYLLAFLFISGSEMPLYYFRWNPNVASWIIIGSIYLIFISIMASRDHTLTKNHPLLYSIKGNLTGWLVHILCWSAYLMSYEWLLRGVLFGGNIAGRGCIVSIILNTIIYGWMHIPKGYNEIKGSIPFGIFLCLATYYTKSIWTPFLLHLSLALSFEISIALKKNT